MGTLLKYEFRRSRIVFLGILGISVFVEILYLIGWFFDIQPLFAIGLIGGILCLAFGSMAILLYGVIMFNDDISKKPGYLLFSTPRSANQIVGAKLCMTLFALIGMAIVFSLLIALDIFLALQQNGMTIVSLISMIDQSVTQEGMKDAIFNGYNIFGMAMYILSSIISFIMSVIVAYVSIILTKTMLGNSKGRVILAIIFWFIITNVISTLAGFISLWTAPDSFAVMSEAFSASEAVETITHVVFHPCMYLPTLILSAVCSVGGYFLTTWMIDKKLSV